jgi:hypothetical protein
MKRRPPSLRRVVVEGHCPGFTGTTRTLRLPATLPAALRFLRLAVPPLRRDSLPRGGRRAATRPGCLFTRPPAAPRLPVEMAGSLKFSRKPSCRPARAPSTPVGPPGTGRYRSRRRGHGIRQRPWLPRWKTFEARSRGLPARCLRFKAPDCPDAMQDSLLTCAAPLWWAGFAPAGSAVKGFSYVSVFTSHSPFASLT